MAFSRVLDFLVGRPARGRSRAFLFARDPRSSASACLVREVWRRGGRIDGGELAATWGWALAAAHAARTRAPALVRDVVAAARLGAAPDGADHAARPPACCWRRRSGRPSRCGSPARSRSTPCSGRWVVTPIVLVLLIRSILDLRSRVRIGLPLRRATMRRRRGPGRRAGRRARARTRRRPRGLRRASRRPRARAPTPSRSSASRGREAERGDAERRRGRERAGPSPIDQQRPAGADDLSSSSIRIVPRRRCRPGATAASSLARRRQRPRPGRAWRRPTGPTA